MDGSDAGVECRSAGVFFWANRYTTAMRFRRLRIAWSGLCGLAAVLLIMLWIRGVCVVDVVVRGTHTSSTATFTHLQSGQGTLSFVRRTQRYKPEIFDGTTEVWQHKTYEVEFAKPSYVWKNTGKSLIVCIPIWPPVILAVVSAAFPWLPLKPKFRRFTLLAIATLFVVGLAWVFAPAVATKAIVVPPTEHLFGRSQVEEVIRDRPEMGKVINREPALREMLESGFEGDAWSGRVHWDDQEPTGPTSAEHWSQYRGQPTSVRVSKNPKTSAVDKCEMLAFELYNVGFDKEFFRLANAAIEKRIARDDYVTSLVRLEFEALMKTRAFFSEHPLAEEADYEENRAYAQMMTLTGDFNNYWRHFEEPNPEMDQYLQAYRMRYDDLNNPLRDLDLLLRRSRPKERDDEAEARGQSIPSKAEISAEELLKD